MATNAPLNPSGEGHRRRISWHPCPIPVGAALSTAVLRLNTPTQSARRHAPYKIRTRTSSAEIRRSPAGVITCKAPCAFTPNAVPVSCAAPSSAPKRCNTTWRCCKTSNAAYCWCTGAKPPCANACTAPTSAVARSNNTAGAWIWGESSCNHAGGVSTAKAGHGATFKPTPITTKRATGRAAPKVARLSPKTACACDDVGKLSVWLCVGKLAVSTKMPPNLRLPSSQISLGHLSPNLDAGDAVDGANAGAAASVPASAACNPCTTAKPTAKDKPPHAAGASGKPKEKVSDAPAGLCHGLPRCPRPAVWVCATNKIGSHWPARARRINSLLVESTCGNTSTVKPGSCGQTASQIASAGQGSTCIFIACTTLLKPCSWRGPVATSPASVPAKCHGNRGCRTSRGIRP